MSQETLTWLNTQTLIGYTEKRGNAWHYRADEQGDETNHYPMAIPVDDVLRRLFNFTVNPRPIYVDVEEQGLVMLANHEAQVTSDTGDVLGIFTKGYRGHQYREWLLEQVATLFDDSDLGIGSAGLLANRARAWVSVEVPENIVTPEGVEFRPHLLAATSFDGSLSTTYKGVVTNVVCDNTLTAGLAEKGQVVKVRHSRYSTLKLTSAREALGIVHELGEDFTREVAQLCAWEVSARQFRAHLDLMLPVPTDPGRALTIATKKRDAIANLYAHDARVAPWAGSAFGVLQAHNTYAHHLGTVKGYQGATGRGLRNMENALTGRTAALDADVIAKLHLVTA